MMMVLVDAYIHKEGAKPADVAHFLLLLPSLPSKRFPCFNISLVPSVLSKIADCAKRILK